MHMLASQGYVVIAIDSRGSRHRGLIFESHLKGRLVSTCNISMFYEQLINFVYN